MAVTRKIKKISIFGQKKVNPLTCPENVLFLCFCHPSTIRGRKIDFTIFCTKCSNPRRPSTNVCEGVGGQIFKIDFSASEGAPTHHKKKNVFFSNRVKFHIFFTLNKKKLCFASSRSFLKKNTPQTGNSWP